MRYLLDTHIFVWHAKEQDSLSPEVSAIIGDYENELLLSMESVKELLVTCSCQVNLRLLQIKSQISLRFYFFVVTLTFGLSLHYSCN